MLLQELIQRLDKSDVNKKDIDVEDLQEILQYKFGISMNLDTNKPQTRVTSYWLACWFVDDYGLCGCRVYFLDDRLLAISYQAYEDDLEDFTFASFAIKQELKEYILSFAKPDEEESSKYLNLQEDWKDGYKLSHASDLYSRINTHVIYQGQKCKIIYPTYTYNNQEYQGGYKYDYKSDTNGLTVIELPDNSKITIELSNADVCYNII